MMLKVRLMMIFCVVALVGCVLNAGANETPEILSLSVDIVVQGEQGVEQTLVQGTARDAEGGTDLNYDYRIVSGGGQLMPVQNTALYTAGKDAGSTVVFELKVTDSGGASAAKRVVYKIPQLSADNFYLSKKVWEKTTNKSARQYDDGFAFQQNNPDLPNVLLIGDSISIGYTPYVQSLLQGKCNVYRIPENGGNTDKGVREINKWLQGMNWAVIHFNFGLHDFKHIVKNQLDINGPREVSPEEYRKNLEEIVQVMEQTGAKLIWASTTAVPDGSAGRMPGEEVEYNQIAAEVITQHPEITVNDLYALTVKNPSDARRANVHFNEAGKSRQGSQVAQCILMRINEK